MSKKLLAISSLISHCSQPILVLIAVIAAVTSYIEYRDAQQASLEKSAIDLKRKILDSIDSYARAGYALVTSEEFGDLALRGIPRSQELYIADWVKNHRRSLHQDIDDVKIKDEINRSDHYGWLIKVGNIPADDVNKIRFSIIKQLNEYENFVRMIDLGIASCEVSFDTIREISESNFFAAVDKFSTEYNKFSAKYRDKDMESWGVVRRFKILAIAILSSEENIDAARFCATYKQRRATTK